MNEQTTNAGEEELKDSQELHAQRAMLDLEIEAKRKVITAKLAGDSSVSATPEE